MKALSTLTFLISVLTCAISFAVLNSVNGPDSAKHRLLADKDAQTRLAIAATIGAVNDEIAAQRAGHGHTNALQAVAEAAFRFCRTNGAAK